MMRAFRKDESNNEVLNWLWSIDNTFSKTKIKAPVGTKFAAVERPFDPTLSRAIQIASKSIAETGTFEGLLPRLMYTVGSESFEVRGGVGVNELDITYGVEPSPARRKRNKKR